jgi:hypothetical protein
MTTDEALRVPIAPRAQNDGTAYAEAAATYDMESADHQFLAPQPAERLHAEVLVPYSLSL